MSAETGKVLDSFQIGSGVDAVTLDDGQVFASCRDGSLSVISEKAAKYEVGQVVKTPEGARTMGLDPTTHRIYLPTAAFAQDPENPSARTQAKPGTFKVVEVVRHHLAKCGGIFHADGLLNLD